VLLHVASAHFAAAAPDIACASGSLDAINSLAEWGEGGCGWKQAGGWRLMLLAKGMCAVSSNTPPSSGAVSRRLCLCQETRSSCVLRGRWAHRPGGCSCLYIYMQHRGRDNQLRSAFRAPSASASAAHTCASAPCPALRTANPGPPQSQPRAWSRGRPPSELGLAAHFRWACVPGRNPIDLKLLERSQTLVLVLKQFEA
jgi:hypothetical protein